MKSKGGRWVWAGVLLLFLCVSVVSAASWTTVTVDNAADVGQNTSLALDFGGNPHIAYIDRNNGDLKYATRSGGPWTIEVVNDTIADFGDPSLAMGYDGYPHIAYTEGLNFLQYVSKGAGGWGVPTFVGLGRFASLNFSLSGNPHISSYSGGALTENYYTGVGWSSKTMSPVGIDAGKYSSLDFNISGYRFASFYDETNGDLRYASYGGVDPVWSSEIVDSAGNVGLYTSLAFDSSGFPRISYYDATNSNLKYASQVGGINWVVETVDSTGDVGQYSSLAIDSAGNPHISYYDATNGNLKYASRSGGSWNFDVVDSAGDVGRFSSLALDSSGSPFISYYDDTNTALKFASVSAVVPPLSCGEVVLDVFPVAMNANNQLDLDRGDLGGSGQQDILWSTSGSPRMVPENGAAIVNLGTMTSAQFTAITVNQLVQYSYSTTPISGTQIVPNDVFAVRTNLGNYTKLRVLTKSGSNDLTLHLVLYSSPKPCQDEAYETLLEEVFGGSLPAGSEVYSGVVWFAPDSKVSWWGPDSENRFCTSGDTTEWLFVYDPTPQANWEHLVIYYFVDPVTGTFDQCSAMTPPRDYGIQYYAGTATNPSGTVSALTTKSTSQTNSLAVGGTFLTGATLAPMVQAAGATPDCSHLECSHCYAVLISGGVDLANNYGRYYSDISSMYKTLTQTYCYPRANIFVLMSDGTDTAVDQTVLTNPVQTTNSDPNLDGDTNTNDLAGGASYANVDQVLNNLKNKPLTSQDTLFIFTTNHGGIDPTTTKARLWLWHGDYIGVDDFMNHLSTTAGAVAVTMEQCNSGGFVDDFIRTKPASQKRVIATACSATQVSNGNDFSSAWIRGVTTPGPANYIENGGNGDQLISLSEAFYYGRAWDISNQIETPQYGGGTPDGGLTLGLSSCSLCTGVIQVEGGTGIPRDKSSPADGLYEDVNGDNTFNKADAAFFFQKMEWIAANEPACGFDFNANGRIDFRDIVKLYTMAP